MAAVVLARKPTRFATNSPAIAEALNRRCLGQHSDIGLLGGRASAAAVYPPDLCRAICRGLREQKHRDQGDDLVFQLWPILMFQAWLSEEAS